MLSQGDFWLTAMVWKTPLSLSALNFYSPQSRSPDKRERQRMNHSGQLPESRPEPYPSILTDNILPLFVAYARAIPARCHGRHRIAYFSDKKFHR
jgi:hypothetical protein